MASAAAAISASASPVSRTRRASCSCARAVNAPFAACRRTSRATSPRRKKSMRGVLRPTSITSDSPTPEHRSHCDRKICFGTIGKLTDCGKAGAPGAGQLARRLSRHSPNRQDGKPPRNPDRVPERSHSGRCVSWFRRCLEYGAEEQIVSAAFLRNCERLRRACVPSGRSETRVAPRLSLASPAPSQLEGERRVHLRPWPRPPGR